MPPSGPDAGQQALVQKIIAARKAQAAGGLGVAAADAASGGLGAAAADAIAAPQQFDPGAPKTLGEAAGDLTAWDTLTEGMAPEQKAAFEEFLRGVPQVHTAFDQLK